jgi:hypothetical protein
VFFQVEKIFRNLSGLSIIVVDTRKTDARIGVSWETKQRTGDGKMKTAKESIKSIVDGYLAQVADNQLSQDDATDGMLDSAKRFLTSDEMWDWFEECRKAWAVKV